jgi:RNA polymerase sigma-70 factor (ECF subfamily)
MPPVNAEPLRDVSDAALVVAVARYRQDALAEAYRRHAGAVYGLARRLLGNEPLAEEVTQEVFLRLWNHPDRFEPSRGSLRSYLLAQTHGRSVDLLRSEGARRRRENARVATAEAATTRARGLGSPTPSARCRGLVAARG